MLRLAKSDVTDLITHIITYNQTIKLPSLQFLDNNLRYLRDYKTKSISMAVSTFSNMILNCHASRLSVEQMADQIHGAYRKEKEAGRSVAELDLYLSAYDNAYANIEEEKLYAGKVLRTAMNILIILKLDPLYIFQNYETDLYIDDLFRFIHPIQNSPKLYDYILNSIMPADCCRNRDMIVNLYRDLRHRLANLLTSKEDLFTPEKKAELREICMDTDIALRMELSWKLLSYKELPLDYIGNLFKVHKGRNCRNIHLSKSSIDIARYFMNRNTADAADPLRGRDETATIELLVINLALGAKLGLDLAEQTMNARGDSLDPDKHLKMLEEASGWKL